MGEVNDIEDLASELDCKVGGLPSSKLGSYWVPHLSLWRFRMEWKRGFEKDWPCGRDNTSPKEGELPLFKATCLFYVLVMLLTAN